MKTPVEGRVKKNAEGQMVKTPVEGRMKKIRPFILSGKTPHDINPVIV
jgi:hypothetical protein